MEIKKIKSRENLIKNDIKLERSKYLNLPDLKFFIWCNQLYGINRGVYNTIDQWLFENGMISIYHRRIQLLAFLNYIQDRSDIKDNNHKYIRFGHGGLTSRLREFMNDGKEGENVLPLKRKS
jgi:riboflavin kinase